MSPGRPTSHGAGSVPQWSNLKTRKRTRKILLNVTALFALPTAILGAGFLEDLTNRKKLRRCPHCGKEIPD